MEVDVQGEVRDLLPLLQAVLLAADRPLQIPALAEVCEVDVDIVTKALEILTADLKQDTFGFEVVQVANGVQLRTKPQYARFIRALRQEQPKKLSPAALETLAVVAYRQPVVKHDVDALRGVDVAPTLKTLMEKGLVQVVGHRETVGHPALYGTTEEFLKVFGLMSLEDLPTLKELNQVELEPGEDGADAYLSNANEASTTQEQIELIQYSESDAASSSEELPVEVPEIVASEPALETSEGVQ